MDTFERWFTQDLNKPILPQHGQGLVFTGDDGTPLVGVHVTRNGAPADLSGAVSCTVIRADGTTVPVTGGTISGGDVSVVLSSACFNIRGPIGVALAVTSGSTTMTVLKAVFQVDITSTGNIIDPSGEITLDVANLIADIDAAVSSIPADYSDLLAAIAPKFSASTAYAAGAYVWYNGNLYRFTAAHTSGAWIGTDAAHVALAGDVADLKSVFDEIDTLLIDRSVNVFDTATISENTVLNSSGNGTSTSTSYFTSDYINISDFSTTKLYRDNGVAVVAYNAYYVLFDASKAPLGARAVGNVIDTSNAYYLRFSAAPAQLNEVMVCDGNATAPTDYVEYDVNPKYAPLIAQNTADIAANAQDIADLTTTVRSANLIDKSKAEVGFVLANGTISTASPYANYKTSDYIHVEAGKTYTLYYANASGQSPAKSRIVYLLYDSQKSPTATYVNESGVSNLIVTIAVDGFIRVSTVDNTTPLYFSDLLMLIEGTTIIPYEEYHVEAFLSDDINPINSKAVAYIDSKVSTIGTLIGKKWAHCGDSFSDYTNSQFSSGTFVGKDKTYPRLIAERNGMILLQQFMLSGRTMAYPADGTFTNSLTCPTNSGYFQNIPSDVDYVTIMLGINDVNHANGSGTTPDGEDATGVITLGTIDDTTTATYYGAYNTVCAWLRANRPFAHVGIIVTNGTQRQDYTEAQIAVAKKWGYPYINLNGDERTPAFIRCYNPNLPTALKDSLKIIQGVDAPSNTHPNWQTHELESTIIEAWLRSL